MKLEKPTPKLGRPRTYHNRNTTVRVVRPLVVNRQATDRISIATGFSTTGPIEMMRNERPNQWSPADFGSAALKMPGAKARSTMPHDQRHLPPPARATPTAKDKAKPLSKSQ